VNVRAGAATEPRGAIIATPTVSVPDIVPLVALIAPMLAGVIASDPPVAWLAACDVGVRALVNAVVTVALRRASGNVPELRSAADTLVATDATSTYSVDSQRYNFELSDARYSVEFAPVAGKLAVVA
jgi:hypothetical protein